MGGDRSIANILLCPLAISLIWGWFVWAVCLAVSEGCQTLRRLHAVPCTRCSYYTGCYYLKCTVDPYRALTTEAIDCLDFEPSIEPKESYAMSVK
jgi:hypothetical protein